ncbi:MAG: hypothetical protein QOJ59_1534, partial [Thermomicrobiales bacterium]|nr:hypothetical protein [Thermomicrobiales bacterium]
AIELPDLNDVSNRHLLPRFIDSNLPAAKYSGAV